MPLVTNGDSELRSSSARPRLAPVEAGGATPLRFGDDPYVWASWLYYQEGMTQNDIAQTMGVSRATVITYLNEARERGIVNIAIEPGRLASLTIAQSLKSHFNLRDCLVIPNGADDRALGDRLGAAGAMALRKFLKSGDTLAVTGGRTVMAVGDSLRVSGLQDVTVVQAIGGAIARNPASPSQCASAIASAVNATCVSLSAPAVASSVAARGIMVAEPLVAEQLSILMRANKALFGIASLRPNASFYSDGVFEAAELQSYIDGDAVGVLAARFVDAWGQPVAGVLDDRVIGLSLEDLLRVELRICVAGGIRQGAGDPGCAAPRLRQRARHRRRDRARRAQGRWRRRARSSGRRQANLEGAPQGAEAIRQEVHQRAGRRSRGDARRRHPRSPRPSSGPWRSRGARWWRWTGRVRARSVS